MKPIDFRKGESAGRYEASLNTFAWAFAAGVVLQSVAWFMVAFFSKGEAQEYFFEYAWDFYQPAFYVFTGITPTEWQFTGNVLLGMMMIVFSILAYAVILGIVAVLVRAGVGLVRGEGTPRRLLGCGYSAVNKWWVKYFFCCLALWSGLFIYVYIYSTASLVAGGKGLGAVFFLLLFTPVYILVCLVLWLMIYIWRRQGEG